MASWLYLIVSSIGAWFTWNAHRPVHHRMLRGQSFAAGWLTSELAVHHIAWQAGATALFARKGALKRWPGVLGLCVTIASWIGLGAIVATSRRSGEVVEDALTDALGADYRDEISEEDAAVLARPRRRRTSYVPFILTDPEVEVVRNIRYAEGAGRRHLLDVYKARTSPAAEHRKGRGAPVLLQVHGGGWVIGDKAQQALPLMNHLAARGWICVAANYRLSPKATFPDHLIDLKQAIAWIRRNIADHGGDPEFIVVTGGSAGGHLTAMVGLTANDPRYQPGFEDVDTSVAAAVPFYGIYDFTNSNRVSSDDGMEMFFEHIVMKTSLAEDRAGWEAASPLFQVRADAPPFLVIHGTNDTLAPVGEAHHFVAALRGVSRNPVAYAELQGAQHAFELFHSPRTAHVVDGVAGFVSWVRARHLAGLDTARDAEVPTPA